MLSTNEIERAIKNYICDISGVDIKPNDDIIEMGLLQSMDFIMLISFIGKYTNIELSENDFNKENFRNINAITSLIYSKQLTQDKQ